MKKSKKIALIVAIVLIVSGIVVSLIAFFSVDFDAAKLTTPVYENTYTVDEEFSGISIKELDGDIRFMPAEDDICTIVCYEEENVFHTVDVVNDTLVIDKEDNRKWYEHIGFYTEETEMLVYLPKDHYEKLEVSASSGDVVLTNEFVFDDADISLSSGSVDIGTNIKNSLKIETSSGNVNIINPSSENMNIKTSSGKVTIESVSVGNIDVVTQSGDIYVKDAGSENMYLESSSGEVVMDSVVNVGDLEVVTQSGEVEMIESDAKSIYIKTSSGDVSGSLLSDKIFVCETDSGEVDVPISADGGRCEVKTSSGDIEFTIK